jgi:hypothetical protein
MSLSVAVSLSEPYSNRVTRPLHRLPILLRITLLGLLMLSVLSRPLYSTWCETHQLSHELTALSHQNLHQDSRAERQLDADHARGAHGSLHGGDQGSTYADIVAVVTVPAVHFDSVLNPLTTQLPVPVQRVAALFRPPIA